MQQGECSCYAGSDGNTACVADGSCNAGCRLLALPKQTELMLVTDLFLGNVDADCTNQSGGLCAQNTCCGSGVCLYASDCNNPNNVKRIFAVRDAAAKKEVLWSDGWHIV